MAPSFREFPRGRCQNCSKEKGLLKCNRCRVILYCSKEHQMADYPNHKRNCRRVSKWRQIVKWEKSRLQSYLGDIKTPPDLFVNAVGKFWKFQIAHDYMEARLMLVCALGHIKTSESVQAQLDNLLDMLRLDRDDNLTVRVSIPALMLRLGQDKECLEFIKWWALNGGGESEASKKGAIPYLNVATCSNPVEPFVEIYDKFHCLSHLVAFLLLKQKVYDQLMVLKGCILAKPILRSVPACASLNQLDETLDYLGIQIDGLYKMVDAWNHHFWLALLTPRTSFIERTISESRHTIAEVVETVQTSYDSWVETLRALERIEYNLVVDRVVKLGAPLARLGL